MAVSTINVQGTTYRIMLVDDDRDITYTLEEVLTRRGFQTKSFNDPVEALGRYEAGKYDVVLLDFRMPVMDGIELYRRLKEKDENIPAVFLTASELPEGIDVMRIRKPVDIKSLSARLVDLIKKRKVNDGLNDAGGLLNHALKILDG